MKKVILYGANGAMGKMLVEELSKSNEYELMLGVSRSNQSPSLDNVEDKADLLIDFSHPSNLDDILNYSKKYSVPTLIATTGFQQQDIEKMKAASIGFPLLLSTNTSIGINLITKVLSQIGNLLEDSFDVEIIEKHHNKKLDSPSGTAKTLAVTLETAMTAERQRVYGRGPESPKRDKTEIGIHSIRGGTYPGEHTVIFAGEDEIIEIKHTALSKRVFAIGALKAGHILMEKPPGYYEMKDIY